MPYKDAQKQKECQAQHYQENKDNYRKARNASRQRKQEKLAKLKSKPCLDCGKEYPGPVMVFHHREPQRKTSEISKLMTQKGWQAVLEEIKKCDLLCHNCHIIRHIETEWRFSPTVEAVGLNPAKSWFESKKRH